MKPNCLAIFIFLIIPGFLTGYKTICTTGNYAISRSNQLSDKSSLSQYSDLHRYPNQKEQGNARFEIIVPNVYRFKDACNSYLLKSGSSGILIDAGSDKLPEHFGEARVDKIEWILHTHCHRDQCIGDLKLRKQGANTAIGKLEASAMQPADIKAPLVSDTSLLIKVSDWSRKMAPFQKPGINRELTEGEVFSWKQYKIQVINTPGHTEGSVSYMVTVDDKKICFSGDLIMEGGHVHDLYSMQWIYLENPGIDSSITSLEKIRAFGADAILPSHGEVIYHPSYDIQLLKTRLQKVREFLHWERAGRWNWSGFVQMSEHVIQDCGTTSQIILSENGEALLFDCGKDFTLERLAEAKRKFGFKKIALIIPSHWHYDHIDGITKIAKAEGSKVWVWEGLTEHLEFPERFPTTCWTGKKIKADRILHEGEEFQWGGISFKVYHNPAHMEEQMGLFALADGLRYFFIGDGTAASRDGHVRSSIHCLNGISLTTGLIKTAQSFYNADPYICVPAHSNGFATHADTRDEFINWAIETTDAIKALLPATHPEMGYNPYWATFYPAKIKIKPGEKIQMNLRLKNCGYSKISGKFWLKSYGNLGFDKEVQEYVIEPGEIKDLNFIVSSAATASPGIYIITADILYDNELFAEFPQGYLELEK